MSLKDLLLREKIIKIKNPDEEPFVLKSGKRSRLFIDIKQASLNHIILNSIVNTLLDFGDAPVFLSICSQKHQYREEYNKTFCIGSVAIGGISIATALSIRTGINQIIVRSEKHDRGTATKIIGNCEGNKLY